MLALANAERRALGPVLLEGLDPACWVRCTEGAKEWRSVSWDICMGVILSFNSRVKESEFVPKC